MNAGLRFVRQLGERPFQLYGAAVARILLGAAGLHFYVSNFAARRTLWSDAAILSGPRRSPAFIQDDVPLLVGLLLAMGIATLLMIYGGHLLAVAHGVMIVLFYSLNPYILDGGDNFVQIVVWFVPLLITNAHLSPNAGRHRAKLMSLTNSSPSPTFAFHNLGLFLIAFQVSVIYVVAGLAKVVSEEWRGGVAMYIVARYDEFSYLPFLPSLTRNPLVTTALSYSVVAVQLMFVPLVLNRRTRVLGVIGVGMMHLGIMIGLGLVGFALSIFVGLSLLIPEPLYRRVSSGINSKLKAVVTGRRRQVFDRGTAQES